MRKLILTLFIVDAPAITIIVLFVLLGGVIQPMVTILITLLSFVVALLHSGECLGWARTLLLVALTFVVSLMFESIGVASGLIYGPYHYTTKLGPMFLGLVPYLIPLAWFMMIYPSYVIAERVLPLFREPWQRFLSMAALGALIMTAWDLALDPLMVKAGHWIWEVDGAYFGVPVPNYLGWWVTTFVTLLLFLWLGKPPAGIFRSPDPADFVALPVYLYAINGLSSIVTAANLGLEGPALVGVFAMLPWVIWGLAAGKTMPAIN